MGYNIYDHAEELVAHRRITHVEKIPLSTDLIIGVFDNFHTYSVRMKDENDHYYGMCDCSEFKEQRICPHVLAAKIYLDNEKIQKQNRSDDIDSFQAIDMIQQLKYLAYQQVSHDNTFQNLTLSLDITINGKISYYSDQVYMSLRAGRNKLYVIKRIDDFIYHYRKNEPYKLGKNEVIDWQNVLLTSQQQELLLLLEKAIAVQPEYRYNLPSKCTMIHSLLIKDFIALSKKVDFITFKVDTNLQEYSLNVVEDTVAFHIKIGRSSNSVLVSLETSVYFFSEANRVLIVDDRLYYLSNQQFEKVLQIHRFFSRTNRIMLPKMLWHDFLSYAVPLWKDVAFIKIDKFVHDLIQQPAKSELLITNDNDRIIATVTPMIEGMIDVDKEQRIHEQLVHSGFQVEKNKYVLDLFDKQKVYQFFDRGVNQLETIMPVTNNSDITILTDYEQPTVDIAQRGSLFDISFNMGGISQKDIENILAQLTEKDSIYQLENGSYINLDDDAFKPIHKVLRAIRGQASVKQNKVQLNRLQVVSINQDDDVLPTVDNLEQLIHDLRFPEQFEVSIPKLLQTELKKYQKFGFQWLKMLGYHQLGGILADDMGLGKTVQTIAYILSEVEENKDNNKPFLIIAPASLVYNWAHELKQFAPSLTVNAVVGTKTERVKLQQRQAQVVITSYTSYRQDELFYNQKKWHTVILDESQYIKNYATKIHQNLRKIDAQVMFALSGTPIENRKEDLWSVFSIILPGLFPTIKAFKQLSSRTIAKMAKPFVLRRLKEDVLLELPPKIESVQYNDLTKEQKTLYLAYLQRMQQEFSYLDDEQLTKKRIEILSGITRLRQICNHPSLFVEQYEHSSGKLEQCLELVQRAIDGGHRVLIFSQFASMLDILEQELLSLDVSSFKLTGKTPVKQRLDMVNAFNNGENDVFLMSLKAGGTGLNLTSADTIILFDLWWNPAVEEQAAARAHRIGQSQTVQVYRLVSNGTIEEKILQLQHKKRQLFDDMISTEQSKNTRFQLSNDDIKEILGIV